MMSEAEKAWLACAIDTEGHISLNATHPHQVTVTYKPYVTVSNTNREFIERVKALVHQEIGVGSMSTYRPKPGVLAKKTQYRFSLISWKLKPLLTDLLPYLIVKRDNAERILSVNPVDARTLESTHMLIAQTTKGRPRDLHGHLQSYEEEA